MTAMPEIPFTKSQCRRWIFECIALIANINIEDLQLDALVREELGIDSLKAMEIVARIEKKLQISIDEGKLLDVRTLEDFFQLIERNCDDK